MSRHAHLPPRCPFQKKIVTRPCNDPVSPSSCKDMELYPRHQKSVSQSSILEDQRPWLDNLLSDSYTNAKGALHQRSPSDSMTLLDGLDSFPSLTPPNDDDISVSSETGSALESACIYGPNSPRKKGIFTFPENAIVSALSEYLSPNPKQYLDGGLYASGMVQCDLVQDSIGSAGEANTDTKAVKRHSGQRSRVRKLQYIAELERTVDVFQTLESELVIRVASLLQQRAALSMENSTLKQQVARLEKEKLIVDGKSTSISKERTGEVEIISIAYSSDRNVGATFRSSSAAEGGV
ncbi:Basic leucine zipper like [Actinidia chinensis var. chinensis]|uniref:Basic leucine zipper like n=1 Tax=Actinidia chinensis var. chinensis TaxID=1590841 RepID=A0A2R6PWF7_ACTCC|nr:Basic leucine zipper like [Actinidia chinensis var. chinensis]